MKKILIILSLSLLSTNTLASVVASSESTGKSCGDNCTWSLDSDGTLTISGSGEMSNFGWNNSPWYASRDSITSLKISDKITSIGNNAFLRLGNLSSVTIPASVKTIGSYAFYKMPNLQEVNFAENSQLESIDRQGFSNNPLLTTISLPEGLKSFGYNTFWVDQDLGDGLVGLVIPESVETIGTPGIGAGLAGIKNIYCSAAQINGGVCDSSKIRDYYYDNEDGFDRYPEDGVQVYRYEKEGNHYNIYDANGRLISQYGSMTDFGTNNFYEGKRIYTVDEATKAVKGNKNTFSIRYR